MDSLCPLRSGQVSSTFYNFSTAKHENVDINVDVVNDIERMGTRVTSACFRSRMCTGCGLFSLDHLGSRFRDLNLCGLAAIF